MSGGAPKWRSGYWQLKSRQPLVMVSAVRAGCSQLSRTNGSKSFRVRDALGATFVVSTQRAKVSKTTMLIYA